MSQLRKFMVLRDRARAFTQPLRGNGLLGFTRSLAAPEPELVVAELSKKDILDAQVDPGTLALAAPMQMKLVEPRGIKVAAGFDGPCTWGVEVTGAATSPYTGDGVVVAVLDSGIDADHPAFAGVELRQRDFTGQGNGDVNGHGTHCAGTIFGRSTAGVGRFGVAPGIRRALIGKVLHDGAGNTKRLLQAMQWAVENGAHVLSISLALDYPGELARRMADGMSLGDATAEVLDNYLANIRMFEAFGASFLRPNMFGTGTLIVAAAGNESDRGGARPRERPLGPPAASSEFVSVGAVASLGAPMHRLAVADFSNTGPQVCGPGVDVFSAYRGGYAAIDGTSMATPHVAGVAALWAEKLMRGAFGGPNVTILRSRLIGQASQARLLAGFDGLDVGAGVVQAPQE